MTNLNYVNQIKNQTRRSTKTFKYSEPNFEEILSTSTDGPNYPVSKCYNQEFLSIMDNHSFTGEFLGSTILLYELAQVRHIYDALCNEKLNKNSTEFLKNLTHIKIKIFQYMANMLQG